MLTPKITKILQKGTKASIDTLNRIYGRDCELYYPKGTGVYSGAYNDIDWESEPDEVRKLFIPNLFSRLTNNTPLSQYDTFSQSDYYIILDYEEELPRFTKVVAESPTLGIVRLVVRANQIVSTFEGNAYNRVELEPLFDSSQDNDLLTDLRLDSNQFDPEDERMVDNKVSGGNGDSKYQFYLNTGGEDYYD